VTTEVAGLGVERDERIATVTIDRVERRNALSRALLERLPGVMSELSEDPDVWVIIVTGAGDRAFSAGGDLKELDPNRQQGRRLASPMTGPFRNAFEAVLETPKPTIASIGGVAFGGGLELALACDLRIAADHARFSMPEATLGMGANFAAVLLPRLIPRAIALQMLYTGEVIDATTALRIGLVNDVVPYAELGNRTRQLARTIAANAPITVRRFKAITTKGWDLPVSAALRLDVGPNPYVSEDREEGVRAYLEKRLPQWQNR
jgi:enoyl-CoA hydratase